MNLTLLEKLGDGAFADVWRAKDELDRDVAVKIVREANLGVADALAHAKALARANHPNVVSVITLEKTTDPTSGEIVDCVVMELLRGTTLTERLNGAKFSTADVKLLALGAIDGLGHIHAQGMAHGDLHTDNVMVVDTGVKVIDILYLNSLATLTTERRELRLRRDLVSLRILVQQIVAHSELGSSEATEFNNLLEADATCADIRDALLQIVSPAVLGDDARVIDHAFSRLIDPDFIAGEAYAAALAEETPNSITLPLLIRLADEKAYDPKLHHYVQELWARMPPQERSEFLNHLGAVIDRETPNGRWAPGLRLLAVLRTEGWSGLSKVVQLRLEGLIAKDVLAGRKDIHSLKVVDGGALGTYAASFWTNFKQPNVLADNLVSLLRQNWFTQNYVGSFFMRAIPSIAAATGKRNDFVQALTIAVANDARLIKTKLEELPPDWVTEIRATLK